MTIMQALRACRRIPGDLRTAHHLLQHFEASLAAAMEERIADEALAAGDRERARIQRLERDLQAARVQVLTAVAALPAMEGEVAAAYYLGGMSVTQTAIFLRYSERHIKRCKARAVQRMTGSRTARKGKGASQ